MPTVAVLSAHRHPRLRYVLRELSRDLGYTFRLFTEEARWSGAAAQGRIVYGNLRPARRALRLPAHALLSGGHPTAADLTVEWMGKTPCFFSTGTGPDLLSCLFYCLSRYEEYQSFTPDGHDRFPARASHAQQNAYLSQPVARRYARQLAADLQRYFPRLPPPKVHPFRLQPTYDIDLLWAYKHRGLRGAASGLQDVVLGKPARVRDRFFPGSTPDPYFNLDYLLGLHPEAIPYIFWLLADNECREDVNPYPVPDEQTEVMRTLTNRAVHGVHPGYATTRSADKLKQESGRFQRIFNVRPRHSRQHFLRLRLPDTYRALCRAGITHDHSMGYGDAAGWRAGTNLPFYWYDLRRETMTGLTVHPFCVMDVTLKNYLGLTPQAASVRMQQLMDNTYPFGGDFTLLWHNSSFADAHGWTGWRAVYETLFEVE